MAQQGSARTWYTVDALGSVRATLNDAGMPQGTASYDAWGVPETPLLGSFGFTGEVQRGSDVWLRARWYGAGRGGFGARDAWVGWPTFPASQHPYQYTYQQPTRFADPSGQCIEPVTLTACLYALGEAFVIAAGAYVALDASYRAMESCGFDACWEGAGHTPAWEPPPPPPSSSGGVTQRVPHPQDSVQLGPSQGVDEVCTVEQFPLSGEQPRMQLSFPLPEEQRGPIVMSVSENGVTKYQPSDLAALKRFANEAVAIQQERGYRSFGKTWWDMFPLMLAEGGDIPNNTFFYKVNGRITGVMVLSNHGNFLEVTTLEGFGSGAGTNLLQAAVKESIAKGYGGELFLEAAEQAISFYEERGFVRIPPNKYHYLSKDAAQKLLKR